MNAIGIDGVPEGYEAVSVTLDPEVRLYHDETHIKTTSTVMFKKIQPIVTQAGFPTIPSWEELSTNISPYPMEGTRIHVTDRNQTYIVKDGKFVQDDPLREMKIQQAVTGQPVWVRTRNYGGTAWCYHPPATTVYWDYGENAEYSFTEYTSENGRV